MKSEHGMPVLNREAIKYFAVFTMLLNHIAEVFLEPETLMFEVLTAIGYFTAITMIYFLIEGYGHTHSKKNYVMRIFVFALISQIPYSLAFSKNAALEFCGMNMMFSLCLCFALVWVEENVKERKRRNWLDAGIICLSIPCDWTILAPVFTLLFLKNGNSKEGTKKAFGQAAVIYGLFCFLEDIGIVPLGANLLYTAMDMAAIGLSAFSILFLYNGKRAEKGKTFSKWFFYLFYPAHLLILGLLRISM